MSSRADSDDSMRFGESEIYPGRAEAAVSGPVVDHSREKITGPDISVVKLLEAYQAVLEAADGLPRFVMIHSRHRRTGLFRWVNRLPRPRWLIRYFILQHVNNTLTALKRRYHAREALGFASTPDKKSRELVESFQQSLPPFRLTLYLSTLIVATLLLGRRTVEVIAWVLKGLSFEGVSLIRPDQQGKARELISTASSSLSISGGSVDDLLDSLLKAGLEESLIAIMGLSLALYLVLRPLVPVFRLKRILFNTYPEIDRYLKVTTARWHTSHAVGIYDLEAKLLEGLGTKTPPELPFDFTVSILGLIVPMWLVFMMFRLGLTDPAEDSWVWFVFVFALAPPIFLRLGWLVRAWRRRRSRLSVQYLPFEAKIRYSETLVELQSPLTILVTAIVTFLFSPVFTLLSLAVWWYRINRELRDFGRARHTQLGRLPMLSVAAVTICVFFIIPPIVSWYRTCDRIRCAQRVSGHQNVMPSPWLLLLGVPIFALLLPYLQSELNRVWFSEGELVPDVPAQLLQ
jgi:hypothetical protein